MALETQLASGRSGNGTGNGEVPTAINSPDFYDDRRSSGIIRDSVELVLDADDHEDFIADTNIVLSQAAETVAASKNRRIRMAQLRLFSALPGSEDILPPLGSRISIYN